MAQKERKIMESIPQMQVQCTTDYSIFKLFPGNRPYKTTPRSEMHIMKLVASMAAFGFMPNFHITTNSKMQVIDGQHRLEAAKRAGVPVYFVIDDTITLEAVQVAGGLCVRWSLMDFIVSNAASGNKSYQKLLSTFETSPLSLGAVRGVWERAYSPDLIEFTTAVRDGTFTMTKPQEMKFNLLYGQVVELDTFSPGYFHNAYPVLGLMPLLTHPDYDHSRMKAKLTYQSTRLVRCASIAENTRLLFDLYNYKVAEGKVIKPVGRFGQGWR
jgi:hypothetical protein